MASLRFAAQLLEGIAEDFEDTCRRLSDEVKRQETLTSRGAN